MFALLLVDSQDERVPEQLDYAGQLRRTFLHFGLSVLSLSATIRSANVPDAGVFDRIGLRSGLSQAYVRCIFQDRRGFVWFGTQDGLNRYDGYTFRVYRHAADDPQSLPNNSIAAITEDHSGVLWVATTGGGIAAFNRATETFTRFQAAPPDPQRLSDNAAQALVEDGQGTLWIGTQFGGLNAFDPARGTFRQFRHDAQNPDSLASDDIVRLLADRRGNLWVATRNQGLDRWDARTGRFQHYVSQPGNPASLPSNRVVALYEDRAGWLWAGTGQGVGYLEPTSGRFTTVRLQPTGPGSLREPEVSAIVEDRAGDLWFGSSEGLVRRSSGGVLTHYRHDSSDERTLSGRVVASALEDRAGTLWFGTNRGISRLSAAGRRFVTFRSGNGSALSDNSIHAIYEDEAGVAWVGTGFGLNRFDPEMGTFRVYRGRPGGPSPLPDDNISSIARGPVPGHLWVGTARGISDFNPATGQGRSYRNVPSDPRSLSDDNVAFVSPDADGRHAWIGTRNGLNRWDAASGQFTRYLHDPAQPDSLAGNEVRAFARDPDGTYWIGTRHHGLERLDLKTGRFQHFPHDERNPQSLSAAAVYALLVDRQSRVWVGTTVGLNLLDRASGTFTRFTMKDGLPNDTVYALREDAAGQIWMSTNSGLARLDPDRRQFRVYNISHGLQDNEFNGGADYYAPATHHMYFGGVSGYNRFRPEAVEDSTFSPPLVVTSFQASGRQLSSAIERGEGELSWKDSMFTVEYAALDYSAPELNRYAYKLENFDQDWHYSSGRTAVYTNLDSGQYLFRVRGTNSDGVWSKQEATLKITIVPPPWKRWWFQSLAGLLVTGAVAWAYRMRVQQFRTARAAQEQFSALLIASQEAERKRIAAELHDSIGQNLSVIRNQALLAMTQTQQAQPALAEISQVAGEAIDEVRNLARNLRPQQLERLGLTSALSSLVQRAEAASEIAFTTDIDNIDGRLSPDNEIHLYRVVQETLNNILRHSQATEARLVLKETAAGFMLRMEDNGCGIASALDRSHQGFGLTSIRERARILGARHRLESAPGRGTITTLDIDLPHASHSRSHS